MAQSRDAALPPEDLVPIQNFMRRFSHVEAGQEESSRKSWDEGEATLSAAEAAKQPSEPTRSQRLLNWFKSTFTRSSPPRSPREPGRFDFIVLPVLNAKKWIVMHPKVTMTIVSFMLATVVDRMPYYAELHASVCKCVEDEASYFAFIIKRFKYLILCV